MVSGCGRQRWANEVLYGGYAFDAESGLYHTDAREYHGSLGRFVQIDPIGLAAGPNVYAYCNGSPADTVDPSGLIDLDKFKQGIWDAGAGAIDFLAGMGAGDSFTSDPQQMANGEADFLCGLLTAAEGLADNPVFGKLRDLVRTAQGMANAGLMVAGAFRMAKGLSAAAKPGAASVPNKAGPTGRAARPVAPGSGGRLTRAQARDLAKYNGFKEVRGAPFNSHGQPVFTEGKKYYTPDVDAHRGGVWKVFDKKGNRIGTVDVNLNCVGR